MEYIIELEKIEGTDLYRAKGANTLVFDEWGIKNILKPLPEPEPEVDWSKVAVDTPILTSMDGIIWSKRHFARYENGSIITWWHGKTSFTTDLTERYIHAKLAEVGE